MRALLVTTASVTTDELLVVALPLLMVAALRHRLDDNLHLAAAGAPLLQRVVAPPAPMTARERVTGGERILNHL